MNSSPTNPSSPWQRRLVTAFLCLLAGGLASTSAQTGSARTATTTLLGAPLYFEANQGQLEGNSRFIARGRDFNILLEPTQATLVLGRHAETTPDPAIRTLRPRSLSIETRTVRFALQDANTGATMRGAEPLAGKANYLIGNDPAEWRTGVPLFSRVQVDGIYPGINLVYHADASSRLEYDFIAQPGARPDRISFRVEGADSVRVDAAGDLVLKIGAEEVRQHKPFIYQETAHGRRQVQGGYRLAGRTTVGFRVGEYDSTLPLIIDPVLSFSTYLGGSKAETGWAIALDGGSIYVAGETLSRGIATAGALSNRYAGGIAEFGDAFVAKYTGTNLDFLTYLGGKTDDGAYGVAADANGVYVTGFTDSKNFPLTANAVKSALTGRNNNSFRLRPVDAFVTHLDTTGSTLIYSTLLGGDKRDSGFSIAVDATGIYVAGLSESDNFIPAPNGFQTNAAGGGDGFVTKLSGGAHVYTTFLGGSRQEIARDIVVDASGSAFVTGFTFSRNFPTTNVIVLPQGTNAPRVFDHLNNRTNSTTASDAFVVRLSPDGSALEFSTYLGGRNNESGSGIAVDATGVYVAGQSASGDFPVNAVPAPVSVTNNFNSHAFASKLSLDGSTLLYSTQFGGNRSADATGIAVDSSGRAFICGFTSATNFFATNAPPLTDLRSANSIAKRSGKQLNNAFIAVLDSTASAFVSSIYLGGSKNDEALGIAVDPSGSTAYVVGRTVSTDWVTTNAPQTRLGNSRGSRAKDAFIGRLDFP